MDLLRDASVAGVVDAHGECIEADGSVREGRSDAADLVVEVHRTLPPCPHLLPLDKKGSEDL